MGIKDKIKQKAEEEAKAKAKKALKRKAIPIMAGIAGALLVLLFFYAIIMTVENTLMGLMSNVTTSVSNFWKWMTDDYWIKLDEEIEFSYLDEETRRRDEK